MNFWLLYLFIICCSIFSVDWKEVCFFRDGIFGVEGFFFILSIFMFLFLMLFFFILFLDV